MNTKDITVDGWKGKYLVYGKSGTGKTTFASTFPIPYIFDFDGGVFSLRGLDVEYDVYTDWRTCDAKLKQFETKCPYETIVLDSVTTMQEYMMKDILTLNSRAKPTLQDWGQLVMKLGDTFLWLSKMAQNVVVTAHELMLQDDITGEILIQPLIYGKKLPGQLPLWFDECYRAQVGRGKDGKPLFQLLTVAHTKYTAKSRLRVLDTVEVADYKVIMEKVRAGK